ncbi:serine hydroxymethyltransferase [Streptomyces sp. NBC_00151]|jgi:glycine hydroxymethyltransferase|uniref:serine hydroxymethyltransferase n=1 Tax=Streptomyces sp. NBC_00151 TaxID=2975669 RepID=UPI002DDBC2E0|nr:serine hydroxymethyltransferase [Streptomyces sp. NBC_00151]WRZ40358.1 serine hydroxymethyltransferase [Streptomyces sp. NBC_00151]
MTTGIFRRTLAHGADLLAAQDEQLYELLEREQQRQHETLAMVAAASMADPSVLVCEASSTSNVTTEGYPGARYHAGCEVVDEVERLAVERAKEAFGARYANVQPHSGSTANQVVLCSLLNPGDVVLGMDLKAGGHLTHGASASMSGRFFTAIAYGLGEDGLIDYDAMARLARTHRPKLIFCGASSYPRTVDFQRFREVADEVGAYLVADISHIAGLVAAGLHPSPVDVAHVTTTSTYKQLYGPRGGLILVGRDAELRTASGKTLAAALQDAVFPYLQGTPRLNTVAAKARALGQVCTPEFRQLAERIVATSAALAKELDSRGHHVLTGGTDTHMVLLDVGRRGLTGRIAERALESCGIVVNKNSIPGDPHGPRVTSGVRLGTNVLALRGMGPAEMTECAELVDTVLGAVVPVGDRDYELDSTTRAGVAARATALCHRFPLPDHPLPTRAVAPTAAVA